MNSKLRNLAVIMLVFFLYGCSSSGSKESTTSQDTITTDTTNVTETVAEAPPVVISVADAVALDGKVKAQFETLFKDITDTTKYIKVILLDNYNEYEGQDEAWEIEFYYDKTFSLRYMKEIHITGVVGGNNINEYILDGETIAWAGKEYLTGKKSVMKKQSPSGATSQV